MIIDRPGTITERITFLGKRESCIYLLGDSDEYTILGGGMTYIIPDVMAQLEALGIDEKRITRLIILHAHFDHTGIVPYCRKRWPWISVCASKKAQRRFGEPRTVETIVNFNTMLLNNIPEATRGDLVPDAHGFVVDEVLADGDVIRCGDLHLEVMEVPGHSTCSIAVYVPEEKALFASDAGGILFQDTVFTAANSNFDHYQQSLEKMAGLDIAVYLAEHYGALTGKDAKEFLPRSIESARQTRALIEETYRALGDVSATTEKITEMFTQASSGYFLPREIMQMVIGQMTGYLARTMDAGKNSSGS
ncbi:MAG TPA: MBL fold metallo-hydrolase [Deltaproteobacteria bacterium]|nr:MBL fold metallo-hydrolase [Deltaproteobacteria bacterium]